MTINAQCGQPIILGWQTENAVEAVVFDKPEWLAAYGPGTFELVHKRRQDTEALPVPVSVSGGTVTWTIEAGDVLYRGRGEAQLRYFGPDGKIKCSEIYTTQVERSLVSDHDVPEPYEGWVEQVIAAAANAELSRQSAETAETGAQAAEANAEAWATGGTGGTPSATNNAKYYAEQAGTASAEASAAQSGAEAAQTAAETAQSGAETAQAAADAAQTAAEAAQTAAEAAQTAAETAQAGAEAEQENAASSAAAASGSATNAASSASAAASSAASVAASAAQIETNKADISKLKKADATQLYTIDADFSQGVAAYNASTNRVSVDPGSAAWINAVVTVQEGYAYTIHSASYNNVHYAVLFTDDDRYMKAAYEQASSGQIKMVDATYKAPSGATRMYVNCYVSALNNPGVYEYTSTEKIEGKISTVNANVADLIARTSLNKNPEFTVGQWTVGENNIVTRGTSTSWKGTRIDVVPGYIYHVKTTIYSNVYYGLIFTDIDNRVIAAYEKATSQTQKQIDVTYAAPVGASYLYINYRINAEMDTPEAVELFALTEKNIENRPFVVASVNCGAFDHYRDDDVEHLTTEEYLENWKKTINGTDFDVFALVDCPYRESSSPYYEADMFGGIVRGSINLTAAKDQYMESRLPLTDPEVLQVTQSVTVDGQTYTNTGRCKFLKTVLNVGLSKIAVYAVHASPQLSNGYEYLRAAQFADLLSDAADYDGFIAVGDYNCQTADEYNVFTSAGCHTGNCSYLGTINTLRDIPADNIVTSPNILIRRFTVLDDYVLNSDHLPICATVEYMI